MVMESNTVVNRALKYIDEHLEEPILVQDVAGFAGYSEYHFARMFKAYMNVSVMEYVTKRRLIRASEDIINGEKIIDVAIRYGWQSHSGFTKSFKKEFGFYPSFLRAMIIEMRSYGGSVMNHVFLEQTKQNATKEELFEILQAKVAKNGIDIKPEELKKVYNCACKAYEGVKRYSGDEYVTHLLNVAIVLTELGSGANVVMAGMFCDVAGKGTVPLESLKEELHSDVYEIIRQAQDFDTLTGDNSEEVVIIKLAERLHNMRTIEFIDEEKQKIKAKETLELFMPLARKLGNKKLIDEMNDISMKYL